MTGEQRKAIRLIEERTNPDDVRSTFLRSPGYSPALMTRVEAAIDALGVAIQDGRDGRSDDWWDRIGFALGELSNCRELALTDGPDSGDPDHFIVGPRRA